MDALVRQSRRWRAPRSLRGRADSRHICSSDLKKVGVQRASRFIAASRHQQTWNQRRPQKILLTARGMLYRQGRSVGPKAKARCQSFVNEAHRDRLKEPRGTKRLPDSSLDSLLIGTRCCRHRDFSIFRYMVIAVHPPDLLNQVAFALQIPPPTWGANLNHRGVMS